MDQCWPHPVVLQRWCTGPLRTHIDAVGPQWSRQGDTSAPAKDTMRRLADRSRGRQQHALTAGACHAQLASDFLPER